MSTPISELAEDIGRDAKMHRRSAEAALRNLIQDATVALDLLESEMVQPSIGGAVLNAQYFQDAERALVRYWDAAGYALWARATDRREDEQS